MNLFINERIWNKDAETIAIEDISEESKSVEENKSTKTLSDILK